MDLRAIPDGTQNSSKGRPPEDSIDDNGDEMESTKIEIDVIAHAKKMNQPRLGPYKLRQTICSNQL